MLKIDDIHVNKTLVSNEEPYGKKNSIKYLIGYNDNDDIRPLCIILPQMIQFVKYFDIDKRMSFKVSDKKLLKKYTEVWGKIKNLMNIKFDSKPVYDDNDKYINTKVKIYDNNVNTNFHGKKVPKENASCKFLSLIMLNSLVKVKKNPQTVLEQCKYEIKKTKLEVFINDELEPTSSDDESDNDSDTKSDNESNTESDNKPNNE